VRRNPTVQLQGPNRTCGIQWRAPSISGRSTFSSAVAPFMSSRAQAAPASSVEPAGSVGWRTTLPSASSTRSGSAFSLAQASSRATTAFCEFSTYAGISESPPLESAAASPSSWPTASSMREW